MKFTKSAISVAYHIALLRRRGMVIEMNPWPVTTSPTSPVIGCDNVMKNVVMRELDARQQATRHFLKWAQRKARG